MNTEEKLLQVLKALAIRFPVEHKTSIRPRKCGCAEFDDTKGRCRHLDALDIIAQVSNQ